MRILAIALAALLMAGCVANPPQFICHRHAVAIKE